MDHQCEYYVDLEVTLPPADDFTVEEVAWEGARYENGEWVGGVPTVRLYCEAPATVTIRGEQDSFGTEWLHYCAGCAEAVYAEIAQLRERNKVGNCEWCKKKATDRKEYRHYDDQPWETSLVCGTCRQKDVDDSVEELDWLNRPRTLFAR